MENYVTEGAISALLVAAAVGYGIAKYTVTGSGPDTSPSSAPPKASNSLPGSFGDLDASMIEKKPTTSSGKKKKGPKEKKAATSSSTTFPPVSEPPLPAAVVEPPASESKKTKKKAKKAKATPAASVPAPAASTSAPSTGPSEVGHTTEDEGEWTTVESSVLKQKKSKAVEPTVQPETVPELPAVEVPPTFEERPREPSSKRALAERMLPKPRKTGVEDMVETPDYPTVARVMRIVDPEQQQAVQVDNTPVPTAQPLDASLSMSWLDQPGETLDDDDGWESIPVKASKGKAKAPSPAVTRGAPGKQTAPETMSKKARQNAARREREKGEKAAAEQERLATLAKHKKALEKVKMDEQWNQNRSKGKVSGGMHATVDGDGRLVWE
ncbi:hypothetical protein DL96DRAFT_1588777 [Flagelloscypha sp. PMI_526]|nr:hypothetical protein DL96DRAFT_1588777 [Flagelloscypha sp. PMI_526]